MTNRTPRTPTALKTDTLRGYPTMARTPHLVPAAEEGSPGTRPLADNAVAALAAALSQLNRPDRLLTAAELAEKLGCDDKKVYRMAKKGLIPFVPFDGQKRFDWSEVLDALKGMRDGIQRS